ncbi:hypothetical protein pb186bvf_000355 [Paramecium bursaria]
MVNKNSENYLYIELIIQTKLLNIIPIADIKFQGLTKIKGIDQII